MPIAVAELISRDYLGISDAKDFFITNHVNQIPNCHIFRSCCNRYIGAISTIMNFKRFG